MFLKFFILISIIITDNLLSYIIIEHKPIDYFVPNYRIKFSATMKDYYHNFISAQLKFKASSETGNFYYLDMKCTPDNRCEAIIPAPLKSTKEIIYLIEAKDRVGDMYKTQNFSVPQIALPIWQVNNNKLIEIKTVETVTKNVELDGFSEKVQIKYLRDITDNSRKIESRFQPPKEVNMLNPEYQKVEKNQVKSASSESVDLAGVWSIRRTLSTCTSGLYSHKVIKISSFNGRIIESKNIQKGTKFFYSKRNGYLCQLVEDVRNGALVGQNSLYTYQSFFESLKSSLGSNEFVKLLEFSNRKISFELHIKDKILTTVYKREQEILFFK